MANTPNYGWTKPSVGGDGDAWGGELNGTLDAIDGVVKAVSDVANAAPTKAYVDAGDASTLASSKTYTDGKASSTTPIMDGTAAVGSGSTFARADHVHPTDTSRYAASNPAGYQTAAQVTASLGAYLPLVGGTLTGALTVSIAGAGYPLILTTPSAANGIAIIGKVNGKSRWEMDLCDGTAESGSNAGSNFGVYRYNDAGTLIDSPFQINRATGNADFSAQLTSNGGAVVSQAPSTAANPIFFTIAGDGQTVARMYTLGVGHAAIWDNALVSTNLQLDAAGNFQYAGGSGNAYKAGGGPWLANSDFRIKDVLGDYAPGLDEVLQLRPVRYAYKGNDTPTQERDRVDPDGEVKAKAGKSAPYPASSHYAVAKDQKVFVGLIAQEAEQALPNMVTKRPGFIDGEAVADFRDLDTSELIYALVNAVKTLTARVEQLEAARG